MLDLVVGEQAGDAAVRGHRHRHRAGEEVWYGRLNDGAGDGTKGN